MARRNRALYTGPKNAVLYNGTLLTAVRVRNGLELWPTEEGHREARDFVGVSNRATEAEFLEEMMGNGWSYVRPEDIGALTDATIISQDGFIADDGRWYPHPDARTPEVFAHMNYAVEDPVETWALGKPVFLQGDKVVVNPVMRTRIRRLYRDISGI